MKNERGNFLIILLLLVVGALFGIEYYLSDGKPMERFKAATNQDRAFIPYEEHLAQKARKKREEALKKKINEFLSPFQK